jgi:hypothetical protein
MIDQTAADLEGWVAERIGHPGGADRDTLLIWFEETIRIVRERFAAGC